MPEKRISIRRILPVALLLMSIAPSTPSAAAINASVVHSFEINADGVQPSTKMTQMLDGTLYGTTPGGGNHGYGTIYKITTAGQYEKVYQFGDTPNDGVEPNGPLAIGPDGSLYGTTQAGTTYGAGTVFKYTPGGAFQTLYRFGMRGTDAANPHCGLTWVPSEGKFFGVTYIGGVYSEGTVFSITPEGIVKIVKSFSYSVSNPESTLCYNPADGMLYGTADYVHGSANGLLYRVTTTGIVSLVKKLTTETGIVPAQNGISLGADGSLYGTLSYGGLGGAGTIYRISNGVFSKIYDFTSPGNATPDASVVYGTDGALYGTTQSGGVGYGTIFKLTLGASPSLTTLYIFTGSADGGTPGSLLQAANGLLYGPAASGGVTGSGTLFNCTTTGSFFTIRNLNEGFHDGLYPGSRLIHAKDGNWYGTTSGGGAYGGGSFGDSPLDGGTIFEITAAGEYKILHSFSQTDPAGCFPVGLVQAPSGVFYGACDSGASFRNNGAIYKLVVSGDSQTATVTPLFVFENTHGAHPIDAPLLATDGCLFGLTVLGGAYGNGVIYRVTPAGAIAVVHSFSRTDGGNPASDLIQGPDGGLYGTAGSGGVGYGVAFKYTMAGASVWTTAFTADQSYHPNGGLTVGADGNLYGTATAGCAYGFGGIFKLTPRGAASTVASFDGSSLSNPEAPLTLGPDNKLYGADLAGNFFRFDGASVEPLGLLGPSIGTSIYTGLTLAPDGSFYGVASRGEANSQGSVYRVQFDTPTAP